MSEQLTITTLGGLSIRLDGEPVTGLASRKAEALLVYVACAERPQSREVLAELLWEERTQARAMSNLRVVLSSLRKELGPYVAITRDTVALNPEQGIWLDVAELEEGLAIVQGQWDQLTPSHITQIEEAVNLYQGEFLEGFFVRDSPGFEDWAAIERERLRQLVFGALRDLVNFHLETGDYIPGIRHAGRLLELDPLMEEAHRQMMCLLAHAGQRGAALEQYETCRQLLDRELAVEPTPETTALYEQIQAGTLELPALVREREAAEEIPPAPGEPPFKGLESFGVVDADLFFGREALTARLVERLRPTPSPSQDRFLAVVGTSGSGKSSLVHAGLVPVLQQGEPLTDGTLPPQGSHRWPVHVITPTAYPLESLAISLTRDVESLSATTTLIDDLARDPRCLHLCVRKTLDRGEDGDHLLLVIDQFEELFTLCRDPAQRRAFIDNLLTAAAQATGPTVVVIALRADFYHHCAQFENLREALETYQVYIGSMTPEELRRAIEEPAQRNGWDLEPGLVDLLLRDVGDEPGALPLLSHALLETWKRRRGHTLTLGGYAEAGGVHGAIAKTAEAVYQRLDEKQQSIARNIFLRLTELGEGTQDTRRRAALNEFFPRPEETTVVETVINTLADARLITTEKETIQVAHEVLIREWPTLREWLEEDREGLRVHRHLTEAAQEWQRMGRDPGELYRGGRLAQGSEWVQAHPEALNPLEREFLAASEEWAKRREAEREAQRERELEAARKLAEAERQRAQAERQRAEERDRTRRRLTLATMGAAVVFLILAIFGGVGWRSSVANEHALETQVAVRETAQADAENEAAARATEVALRATAQAEAEDAEATALSRQLAAQSANQLKEDNWDMGLLLAIEAGHTADTVEAYAALRRAFAHPGRTQVILSGHTGEIAQAMWNPDESRILTAGFDNTARVWDAETGVELFTLFGHTDWIVQAVWNTDGSRILTASDDGTARVWDTETGAELVALSGHESGVFEAVWNSDERRILTRSADGTARVWDAETGAELVTLSGHESAVMQVAWNGDESRILTASYDGTARVWDAETGLELLVLSGHTSSVNQAAWNSDESRILTAGGLEARVWDAETGTELATLSHGVMVEQAAWNSDGSRILTAGYDNKAWVWDAETGAKLLTLPGHIASLLHRVTSAVWNSDESRILTTSEDGTAQVWDAETGTRLFTLSAHTGTVLQAVWNSDESRILTRSADGTARVWDAETGAALLVLSGHARSISQAMWNSDGSRILTASSDGTARVWDVEEMGTELPALSHQPSILLQAVWNSDESRVLIASDDGTARVWDAQTGTELVVLSDHTREVNQAVWNSDESRILTGSADGTARVWDAETGAELVTLTGHRGNVLQAVWNRDESRILTRAVDGTARVWDAVTGAELVTLPGHTRRVSHAVWNSDESRVLTAGTDGTARVWDARTGAELFILSGHTSAVDRAAWSADESRILTRSDDGTARVWDAETGAELVTLSGHAGGVNQAAWSSDESRILTASADGTARVWDAVTGAELLTLSGHAGEVFQAAWNSDESRILTWSGDGTARVWDARTGAELTVLSGHTGGVNQAMWNADESLILTGSDDGTARVWDAVTGAELLIFSGHTDRVWQALWSRDGSRILTASDDGTVRQWYTRMEDLLEAAYKRAPRNMTAEEWRQFMGDEEYRPTCPELPVPGN